MHSIPPLHLLELHFRATAPIRDLPHYHGPQWNGLFNFILKPYLPRRTGLAQAGFWLHPLETGVSVYEKDDPVHLGVTFPEVFAEPILAMLREFNDLHSPHGHFQPGKTVILEKIACRLSGQIFSQKDLDASLLSPLFPDLLEPEIRTLMFLKSFSLCFHAPLRMKRPATFKQPGHNWLDPDFFFVKPAACSDPLMHLIGAVDLSGLSLPESSGLNVTDGTLTFLDNTYGNYKTPIGGIMGRLKISGKPTRPVAEALVAGQYVGMGKNRTFGLGFYHIPELREESLIQPLKRGRTLLERASDVNSLRKALERLPNSSPGPDGLSKADLKKAGVPFFEMLGQDVRQGTYRPGEVLKYHRSKKDGGRRDILVQNFTDRLVQRSVADLVQPAAETVLSRSAYAYRKGLNRQGARSALLKAMKTGYTRGLKADISAFFDSVDINILKEVLEGLFPFDPLPAAVTEWLLHLNERGISGLPQGSPLSPVLSNLYLDRFDKAMAAAGFRLIRYGDDFVVLVKDKDPVDACLKKVEEALSELGLALNTDKTERISRDGRIDFLGYTLVSGREPASVGEPEEKGAPWPSVFQDQWRTGHPVYLTTLCKWSYSSGPDLVIQITNEKNEKIPWNRISRIVVVGRSSFSGGVVYRAVKEELPVTFIDVMGRFHGQLESTPFDPPSMRDAQKRHAKDSRFCLEFAREIISAKIWNRAVILRRHGDDPAPLREMAEKAKSAKDLEQLRGFEGSADRAYFKAFRKLTEPFEFKGRSYRPPEGPVNAMLSFGYTLLYNRLSAVLHNKGYSSRFGFLHLARGRHFALASDLMEELRHVVDRVVLSLIRKKEIQESHFEIKKQKNGGEICRLKADGFRKYIRRYEHTMAIRSAYGSAEPMSCNAYLDEMADKLRRALKLGVPYESLRIR